METQPCKRCGKTKPLSDFTHYYTHNRRTRRPFKFCKPCIALRNLLKLYGLTQEEYEQLIAAGCAACGVTEDLCVDHCHTTGRVRGVLCSPCNRTIGHAKEDPERLRNLIVYLEKA